MEQALLTYYRPTAGRRRISITRLFQLAPLLRLAQFAPVRKVQKIGLLKYGTQY